MFNLCAIALRCVIVASLAMLVACAARPGAEFLQPTAAAPNARLVTVLAATNRAPTTPDADDYGNGLAQTLRYAQFTISIPPGHVPGQIELPTAARDPAKSFVIVRRVDLDEAAFRAATADLARRNKGNAAVFVHGYNNNFQEALLRAAQLSADLGDAAPIVFAWPSRAETRGYVADRDAVTYSRDQLASLLATVAEVPQAKRVHLVGHSMGGWLTMEALRQLRLTGQDRVISRMNVALAAPDIDAEVFRSQLAVVGKLSPPLVLLVSKDDRALKFSSRLSAGGLRVGSADVSNPLVNEIAREAGVTVVDISEIKADDPFRHNRFVGFAIQYAAAARANPGAFATAGAFVADATHLTLVRPLEIAGDALRPR